MSLTTNVSPLRGKIDMPEGEYEGEIVDTRNEIEQIIDTIDLGEKKEFLIGIKKSYDKKLEQRKKLRHQSGKRIKKFTKKGG